jgi:hypothetical protein
MALATFAIQNIIKRAMYDLRVPQSTIAFLADVTEGRLSTILKRESINVPAAEDLALRQAVARIRKFVVACDPIPVDLRGDPEKLRRCLRLMDENKFAIVIVAEEHPVEQVVNQ